MVEELYFDSQQKKVNHEYIFQLADEEALQGANAILKFIEKTKE